MALPLFVRVGTFGVAVASLALFIDGAYAAKLAERHRVWVDYEKLSARDARFVVTRPMEATPITRKELT